MARRNEPTNSDERQLPDSPTAQLAYRWSRLEPSERSLVAEALANITAGTLADQRAWERFIGAAVDLLPALDDGTISANELHELVMHLAFERSDSTGDESRRLRDEPGR